LDKEGKITHEQFAGQIEARLGSGEGDDAKGPDMKVWNKGRGSNDVSIRWSTFSTLRSDMVYQVDWGSTEFCYSPIIQSKSSKTGYDLKSTAESSDDPIAHSGVFLLATGIRYRGYCANVGRTIIVAPTKVSNRSVITSVIFFDIACLGTRGYLQSSLVTAS
jgi:nucleosome binding factor SPN SPT16 subunit